MIWIGTIQLPTDFCCKNRSYWLYIVDCNTSFLKHSIQTKERPEVYLHRDASNWPPLVRCNLLLAILRWFSTPLTQLLKLFFGRRYSSISSSRCGFYHRSFVRPSVRSYVSERTQTYEQRDWETQHGSLFWLGGGEVVKKLDISFIFIFIFVFFTGNSKEFSL